MILPARRRRGAVSTWRDPWGGVTSLQREMNRLFDDMFDGWGLRSFRDVEDRLGMYQPGIDVSETDQAIKVRAEIPGMDREDINVALDDDVLTISGEKKEEKQEDNERSFSRETMYGAFQRVIPLTSRVDGSKVDASFRNGVLRISLPKLPGEKPGHGKKIEITAG